MSGQSSNKLSILVPAVLVAILPVYGQVAPTDAADQQAGPPTAAAGVARISLLNGDVSVRRGDSGEYVAAAQNAPVMVGDSLQTGAGARAEVQFDIANLIRNAQNTEVHFTDLENGRYQMQLGRGTVTYRLFNNANAQVEIDTPSISVRPVQQGAFRVTVTDDGVTYVTPRNGQVEVFTPKGSQIVQMGQTLMARGPAADPEYQMVAALNRDDWDNWSDSRDQALQQAWATSQRYIPQGVYGTEDLAGQGQWVPAPEYGGYAWAPNVGPDWSPYSVGDWAYEPYYGWTWVSYDPFGWAPFHYGRWFNRPGLGWAWWPGLGAARYYYRPAVVGFFGFGPGMGVGFGNIGWVALAPFEQFHAWWGRGGNGFGLVGGVGVLSAFHNAGFRNGVVGISAAQFGRGVTTYNHYNGASLRSVSLMHGSLPMRPTSQSTHFNNRQTSTVARTNFSQSSFANHMSSPSVQRVGGGFSRYNGSTGASPIAGARAFGSTPGTRNIPQSSGGGGWNRFGSSVASGSPRPAGGSAYRGGSAFGGGSYGGRSQLQVSPPMVRERSSAPSNSGGTHYSAPHYSAPSYSAPHYSAPSHSAPSGGGGHSSGGGGGHASGGGGRR